MAAPGGEALRAHSGPASRPWLPSASPVWIVLSSQAPLFSRPTLKMQTVLCASAWVGLLRLEWGQASGLGPGFLQSQWAPACAAREAGQQLHWELAPPSCSQRPAFHLPAEETEAQPWRPTAVGPSTRAYPSPWGS